MTRTDFDTHVMVFMTLLPCWTGAAEGKDGVHFWIVRSEVLSSNMFRLLIPVWDRR
jgi:hypothetical protein